MKAGFYLAYAMRSLARGGQRTAFAIFCVAVGVLAIVALQLVGAMFNDTITSNIRDLNGGDLAVHIEGGLAASPRRSLATSTSSKQEEPSPLTPPLSAMEPTPASLTGWSASASGPLTLPSSRLTARRISSSPLIAR